ncbi:MAG: PAS domain S-box protein, partial [Gammaproteobacteria bacterium]|nr:PAS domain S-box protein [Gammaproteobacteria bacterium]
GRPVWEFMAVAYREAGQEAICGKVRETRPLATTRRRFIRRDGGELLLEVHDSLVRNAAHEIIGIRSALLDVTERQRAEAALRESEERHRAIIQTAMDGFWRVDMQGRLLEVNETYCRMSGYSAQELLAMRIPDLEAAETDADTAARLQKIMAQGEDRFESRHRRKDGSIFDVEVSVQYGPTEGGRFVAFLRDISARKQAEETLRETNEYLESLFRHANAPMIVWDTQFRITRFNPAFENLTGRSAASVLGEDIGLLFPPSQRESSMELIRATLGGDRWETVEIPVAHADGSVRVVLWNSATVFAGDGETPLAAIAQGHDITGRRNHESERETNVALLHLLNASDDTHQLIGSITARLQDWLGCEAVGIRVQEGDDFPYYETRGFPAEFVRTENSLCAWDANGELLR